MGGAELPIDILIGSNFYWQFMTGEMQRGRHGRPVAIRSHLGWVLWNHEPQPPLVESFVNLTSIHVLRLDVTSQAKTFRTLSRFYTDSRSLAVHQPFERTGMPFERLELTVLKNSSSVRTVRAMRSTKLISRSNGSSYPFEKIHQPFERLELSVRENSSAVRTARAIRSRKKQ